ncbi:DUF1501 domain-containing protein [Prosthecobacter sp.]|uniref:DUF1501 domain-containing protein n=1 Tax=Prosthecobacter sp. TaxID=1965333 RepID=UPI00378399DD
MKPFQAPNILTRRGFLHRSAVLGGSAAVASHTIRDLRLINTAMAAQGPLSGYKALVCIFLSGGNDSNNWIVPTDNTTFADYTAIRGNLALPQSSLLPLRQGPNTTDAAFTDADGHTYGFHPGCPHLQTLFGEKKLGVLFNVGTLVRPTTRADYVSGLAAYRPPQLFSHSDQVTQWQTSIPDQPPTTGWGGRVADLLNSVANPSGSISMSVSLSGANTFEVGNLISQYQVATSGAIVLSGSLMSGTSARARALKNILGVSHTNLQRKAYAGVSSNAIAVGDALNTNIASSLDPTDSPATYTSQNSSAPWRWNTGLTGIYSAAAQPNGLGGFPNTTLGTQLKMVARLIQARGAGAFNMNRQIFFCSVGGYDTHTSQVLVNGTDQPTNANGAHYKLLADVSLCMFAFQRAMEQLGVGNSVTSFTTSDFSRTLPTNSQGSDHGWGSHHLVMGGAVNGGLTYGHLPVFAINGPNDTGLGRWIPTISVDQHSATLAKWFGVDPSEISNIFPNIGRFPTSDLGYMNLT